MSELVTDGLPLTYQALHDRKIKTTQVDRKLLVLAWLASEQGKVEDFQFCAEAKNNFHNHITIINQDLLEPCGMADLDPLHPFEWIIMNALRIAHIRCKNDEWNDDVKDVVHDLIKKMKKMKDVRF
jgi:hypothetical protein